MPWGEPGLGRQESTEMRKQRLNEGNRLLIAERFALSGDDRAHYPHERGVGSIQLHRIPHHEDLAAVFVGDDAPVALIPVHDDLAIEPFLDHITVDRNLPGT